MSIEHAFPSSSLFASASSSVSLPLSLSLSLPPCLSLSLSLSPPSQAILLLNDVPSRTRLIKEALIKNQGHSILFLAASGTLAKRG